MTAFPVMNVAAPLGRKAALVQKLMAQSKYRDKGLLHHAFGGGVPGMGMPFRGGGALTHLNIHGLGGGQAGQAAVGMPGLPGQAGPGSPGWADEGDPINQQSGLQGLMGSMNPGIGAPGYGGGMGVGVGGSDPGPMAMSGSMPPGMGVPPGVSSAGGGDTGVYAPGGAGSMPVGSGGQPILESGQLIQLGSGATIDPITGKIIPGTVQGGTSPYGSGPQIYFS